MIRHTTAPVRAAAWMLIGMVALSYGDFNQRLKQRWRDSYKQISLETIETKIKNGEKVQVRTVLNKTTPFPANPTPEDHHYMWRMGDTTELHVNIIVRRTQALLDEIKLMPQSPSLSAEQDSLNRIKARISGPNSDTTLFFEVCALRRKIAMKNPLLNFDSMIFSGAYAQKPQFHSQQMAFYALPDKGNSLYKVSGFKEGKPVFTDMLATAKVKNGRYKDKVLSNLNGANWQGRAGVFTPEINYDATKVAFAWAEWCSNGDWNGGYYALAKKYRIFEMDMNGTNLRMLTDFSENGDGGTRSANMDEYDPTYLPSGRILWVSERHNGGQRCGSTATSGNMYTMKPTGGNDFMGSDIVRISWHETNERSPAVDYNGKIVYSRWDYVDRHAYSAQSMWLTNPDGSDPRVYHGNYIEDDKPFHPISECDIRPIPNADGKYMGIAGGHHEAYWGNLCVIDINKRAKTVGEEQIRWFFTGMKTPGDQHIKDIKEDVKNATTGAVTRLRWGRFSPNGRLFTTPYPLDEGFVIVGEYDEVLLLDKYRNEILLFSSDSLFDIAVHSPLPVKARTKEPAIAPLTCQSEDCNKSEAERATISVINVNITDTPWPATVKIKRLRICQLVPRPKKPWNTGRNEWWGWSDGALLKAVIGTVPVEADGSVYCRAPIEREIFFQAIDSTGMAVTSMLSGTYVHPGEHLSCIGCHEDKWAASGALKDTRTHAYQKGPARITPELSGSYPLTYARLVYNEVFVPKCWEACHKTQNKGMDFSYWKAGSCENNAAYTGPCVGAIEKYVTYYGAAYDKAYGHTEANMLQMGMPGRSRSRSVPLQIGARACKLLDYLKPTHHNVKLTDEQIHRVALWLDLNAQELGTYQHSDNPDYTKDDGWADGDFSCAPYVRQREGKVVWPNWEGSGFDSLNVRGEQTWGKDFPAYDPDKPVGAGAFTVARLGMSPQLLVRSGQLLLTDVPAGQLEVTLFNLAGRAVATRNVASASPATVNLIATKALGAGTYIARMRLNGELLQPKNQSILISD